MSVLFGNGDGTFQPGVTYGSAGGYPLQIAVSDFNGDGRADVAVPYLNTVSVLLGNAGAATDKSLEAHGGDSKDGNGVSPVLTQTVVKATSGTNLASSANPSTYGETITLTALVSPSTATGTVTFQYGAIVLGSSVLIGGKATVATAALTVGPHSLTANHGGDANDLTSTSPTLTQTVVKAPTATKLTSSPNPSSLGQNVTLTATVVPLTATGTVEFLHGSTVLGRVALNHGNATLATSTLSAGPHSLTAFYQGDANDDPEPSEPLIQVVE